MKNLKGRQYKHDISKLPKWAQSHIADLEDGIASLNGLRIAHAVLIDRDRDWFVIPNKADNPFTLWRLHADAPHAVCSIGSNDIILVGRAT